MSNAAILARKNALSAQLKALMSDGSLRPEQRAKKLEGLQVQLAEVTTDAKNYADAARFRAGNDMTTAGVAATVGPGGHELGRPTVKAGRMLSPLAFDPDELREMHRAVTKGGTFVIDTKAVADLAPQLPAQLYPAPIGNLHETTRVLEHLPSFPMTAPSIEFLKHSSTTGAATTVAAGATKPEITPVITNQVATARKIAAHTAVPTESLDDFATFSNYVMTELMAQVIDAENNQLLNGDGTGTNLLGLLITSGIQTRAVNTAASEIDTDTLEQAILDVRIGTSFGIADLLVLHPTTWSKIRRMKDAQGRYLVNPSATDAEATKLWDLDVVTTTQIAVGTGVVAASELAGGVYIRQGIQIQSSYQSGTDFQQNLVRFVCEERLALAVTRPAAVVKVTGL